MRAYIGCTMHMTLQLVSSVRITAQFLVITLHDWHNIPGWTRGQQLQLAVGKRKFLLATLVNAIFPGVAVAFVFLYRFGPRPQSVAT